MQKNQEFFKKKRKLHPIIPALENKSFQPLIILIVSY